MENSSQMSNSSCNILSMAALGVVLLYLYMSQVNTKYSFASSLNNYVVKVLLVFLVLYSSTQCLKTSVIGAIVTMIVFIVLNIVTGKDLLENFNIMDNIKESTSNAIQLVKSSGQQYLSNGQVPNVKVSSLSNQLPNQLPNTQRPSLPVSNNYNAMLQRFNLNNENIAKNAQNEVSNMYDLNEAENLNGYNISGLVPSPDNTNRPTVSFEEVSNNMLNVNKFLYDLRQTGSNSLVHGMPSELNSEFVDSVVEENMPYGLKSVSKYAPVLADSIPESVDADKFVKQLCDGKQNSASEVYGIFEGSSYEPV
jgi:hypothetical protein